jgi:hypothetical protein
MGRVAHVQGVDEAPARVTNGADNPLETTPAVVFDNDTRVRSQVYSQIRVDPPGIRDGSSYTVVDETPSQRAAFDQKFDLEHTRQNPVKGSDDQLVLTDGQRTHNSALYGKRIGQGQSSGSARTEG